LAFGARTSSGKKLVREGGDGGEAFVGVIDRPETAERDHRFVVCAVLERRACQHEPLEEDHGKASRLAAGQDAYRSARARAVDVELAVDPGVEHRGADRLATLDERDIADQPAVRIASITAAS
jgi:hypothetical protein